jgi:hypothetical protein
MPKEENVAASLARMALRLSAEGKITEDEFLLINKAIRHTKDLEEDVHLLQMEGWIPYDKRVPEIMQKVEVCRVDDPLLVWYDPDYNPFLPWRLVLGEDQTPLFRRREAVTHWRPVKGE